MHESVELKISNFGIVRHYVISFVNMMDKEKADLRIEGNRIKVQSKGAPLPSLFAEVFYKAEDRLRNYVERNPLKEETEADTVNKKSEKKPRVDIPASGKNDKDILVKIKRDLKIPKDTNFVEVFHQFGQHLEKMDMKGFKSLTEAEKIHSPISIFKPELYGYTRGPYFDGKFKSEEVSGDEAKLSTWEFLIRLAGYSIARIGNVRIPSGNKPIYLTVLALPTDLGYTRSNFELMLDSMKDFPGFKPEEGMIMWMAMNLPVYLDELLVVGMKDPAGSSPAEIRIGLNVPLASYRARANEFLRRVNSGNGKKSIQWIIRTAMWEKEADSERDLLKLLFAASQGDRRSREELMLRSSKTVLSYDYENVKNKENRDNKRLYDFCRNMVYFTSLLP